MYRLARNVTQVEMEKIAEWEQGRESNKKFVHAYDRGFLQNWKECVFSPTAARHPPLELERLSDAAPPLFQKWDKKWEKVPRGK